jgi:hypothetical protein
MRLVEFNEKLTPIEYIKRDCQEFLQQADNPLMLYRGMKFSDNQHFIRKKARLDDRLPSAMGMTLHNLLNDYFTERFGEPFRNGIFCTPNSNLASSFGVVHNIFPIGKFSSLWSPKVEDLNFMFNREEFKELMFATTKKDVGAEMDEDEFMDAIGDLWETIRTDDLNNAYGFSHEIMIRCEHYYAMPKSHIESMQDFKKELYSED